MTPAHLLAALPPPELAAQVEAFRARLGLRESPPHVTLKARSGLGTGLERMDAARAVVEASPPFPLTVAGPQLFRNGSALYLAVRSPELVALHVRLLEALKPPQRFGYEGPHMTPHLTLALSRRGVNLEGVLQAAREEFAHLNAQPLTFTVREVWRMRKAGPGALYQPEEAWALGAEAQG